MAKVLAEPRERKDVKWTYISLAGNFQAESVIRKQCMPASIMEKRALQLRTFGD